MQKRMLVTGCGRSGTKYISILLKHCGFDVPHERRMGRDGICSWLFGVDSEVVPWGPSPKDYGFDHIFHLIRNPLACIPSIATFSPRAWSYISRHVELDPSDPPMLSAAKYWLHWNLLVEKRTDRRIRIEEMPASLTKLYEALGTSVDIAAIRQIPNDLNTRRYGTLVNIIDTTCMDFGLVRSNTLLKGILSKVRPAYQELTWEKLEALESSLAEKIYNKAVEYGYVTAGNGR
jgi:hypothetical protein